MNLSAANWGDILDMYQSAWKCWAQDQKTGPVFIMKNHSEKLDSAQNFLWIYVCRYISLCFRLCIHSPPTHTHVRVHMYHLLLAALWILKEGNQLTAITCKKTVSPGTLSGRDGPGLEGRTCHCSEVLHPSHLNEVVIWGSFTHLRHFVAVHLICLSGL